MERKELMTVVFTLILHQGFSQTCPSGTPQACRCANQTVFDCSGAGLTEVPSSLSSATNVVNINLANNNIVTIPTGAFANLGSVTSIDLSNNLIRTLSPGAFDTLNQLASVNLQNNQLTTLDQTAFSIVPLLREIIVDNNAIVCNSDIDWLKLWKEEKVTSNPMVNGNCTSGSSTIDQYLAGVDATTITTTLSFESSAYQTYEGEGQVDVVVVRRGGVNTEIRFTLSAMDGTAIGATDYVVPEASQTISIWQTRLVINVLLTNDTTAEEDETFSLQLSVSPRGETNVAEAGNPNSTTITIKDGDTPVPPPATTTQGNAATSMMEATTNMAATMQPNPMTTKMMDKMTDKKMEPTPEGTPAPIGGPPVAAIVVPIVLIVVIAVVIVVAYVVYKSRQAADKTTAGVRYAAVQKKAEVA